VSAGPGTPAGIDAAVWPQLVEAAAREQAGDLRGAIRAAAAALAAAPVDGDAQAAAALALAVALRLDGAPRQAAHVAAAALPRCPAHRTELRLALAEALADALADSGLPHLADRCRSADTGQTAEAADLRETADLSAPGAQP
jgi:hypothetical protein